MQAFQKDCIFCKIVSGEISHYKIWENASFIAFLDINPVAQGHTLVIPKEHCDYIFDLPDSLYVGLFEAGKQIAPALKMVTQAKKIGMSVVGVDIAHAHLHLIPVNVAGDMDHAKARAVAREHLADMQTKLKAALV